MSQSQLHFQSTNDMKKIKNKKNHIWKWNKYQMSTRIILTTALTLNYSNNHSTQIMNIVIGSVSKDKNNFMIIRI